MLTSIKTTTALVTRALPAGAAPRFTASTDDLDAEQDRIFQDGLSHRDPLVLLFAHESRTLPMGVVTAVHRFPHRTEMSFRWFENDPEVARVRNIYEQGGLSASIGFKIEAAEPNAHGGYDIRKARIHEVSLVPVPANEHARALTKSLSSGRVDDEVVLVLSDDDDEVRYRIIDDAEPTFTVDPVEVARLVRARLDQVVDQQVRAEVRRQTQGWPGLAPASPVVRVEDAHGAVHEIDADMLKTAIATMLERAVSEKVRTAVNALTGRID